MAARYRWQAVAAIWCLLFEWWCTASATVLSQGVGSLEIRNLGRVDVHDLPESGVVWTKEVQALRGEKVQSWSGWTQPKPNSSSQVSQQLQQVAAQLQSACGNDRAQASQSLDVPIVEPSGSGEVIRQIKQVEKAPSSLDVDTPALESARKMLEQQLTVLKTQQKAQQPLSKRVESARSALQRAQRRAEEARVQADQEAARIQVELCTLEQEARKAATEAAGARPLDRCSDIIDNTISALHKAGAPAEHLEQARQAAYTLINGLQGLCAAAGAVTVADEPEDPMMDFDGSDEEFRQMLSKASHDEEIARSVRRRLTYKRSQLGKEISTVTSPGDLLLAAHTTPCE